MKKEVVKDLVMQREEILDWLRETDSARLAELWRMADATRQKYVGQEVHLRGLIELSNQCVHWCAYCGLWAGNRRLSRYCMSDEEILACVRKAAAEGYGTVVLQAGQSPRLTAERVRWLVQRIKSETPLAVTLSLGHREEAELAVWRRAGADRYLLRFETSNVRLYSRTRLAFGNSGFAAPSSPSPHSHDRIALLGTLRRLGYEVGSGVMIGLPGQTYEDLAEDIEWFARLDLDMIGVGPYLPHPDTPMADRRAWPEAPEAEQVPATDQMTYKVMALARLVCPGANIPATTALGTLAGQQGWELGLMRGANVLMINLTPPPYRRLYEIYPGKAPAADDEQTGRRFWQARIEALGRSVGQGRGDSPNYQQRQTRCHQVAF